MRGPTVVDTGRAPFSLDVCGGSGDTGRVSDRLHDLETPPLPVCRPGCLGCAQLEADLARAGVESDQRSGDPVGARSRSASSI
jgi:hypothetical protein